ncbi:hypothetical protein OC861_004358 [Tilletia horrida]|nr:hypothetical protein OC861_004358 [Tilletia horrida]
MSLPVLLARRAPTEAGRAALAAFHTSASSSSSSEKPTRSRKRARLSAAADSPLPSDILPTLLVGPPDPISNLRPIRYLNNSNSSSGAAASGSKAVSTNHHPYSTSEFTSSSSALLSSEERRRSGRRTAGGASSDLHIPPSEYYRALLAQLESASLAHRLRTTRAWSYDHRFWADNNARFTRDLTNSNSNSQATPGDAPPAAEGGNEHAAEFYQSWLSANADRHRAYNRALVSRTFGDLAPEARFRLLVGWVRVVAWWEREVRARVLRLLGSGAMKR